MFTLDMKKGSIIGQKLFFFPPFVHVDKEGGGGMLNVHACPLKEEGGQIWVKFGPRSCWMAPKSYDAISI